MKTVRLWILLLLTPVLGCKESSSGKLLFFGCINCNVQRIDVSKIKPAILDSDLYDPIQIIATYPAEEVKPGNSNLYKCIFGRKGDTVFVFELNKKVNNDILDEIAREGNGAIMNDAILKNPPTSILVYLPKGFQIPVNAKYVFASPNAIEE